MEIGSVMLAAGMVCSALAAVLSIPLVRRVVPSVERLPRVLAVASFGLVTVAFLTLVWASLSSDFTYRYVWEHSSSDLDAVYRLSSVWAGGAGSMLLCTWLVSLVLVSEAFLRKGGNVASASFRRAFTSMMSLLITFFSYTVYVSGLFDRTEPAALSSYPDGRGMDVLLQTPEMALHAPLIFVAYASLCAVFAASAAHLMTGESAWSRISLRWARVAWLTLTAGIGLGAVWAYYVIGWGGYWSWDPVETASLVPWFLVTAFLHTQQRHVRKGEYPVASPMLGMFSMAGVVFVSFVVRAGGLWRSSVHDYGVSSSSSAATRLVSLLQDDPSVMGTLIFLLHIVGIASILSVLAARKHRPPSPPRPAKRLHEYITDENNMLLAVTLLVLSGLVSVALMAKTVDSGAAETAAELNQKMSVLFVALMVVMSLCLIWRTVGRYRTFLLVSALAASSIALGVLATASGLLDAMVAFAIPPTVFAVAVSVVRLAQALTKGSLKARFARAGPQLVHVGTAVMLAAFFVSSNMQSYPVEGSAVTLPVGAQLSVDEYTISLTGMEVSNDVTGYPAGVVQVRAAIVDILEDGALLADDVRLEVLYGYDPVAGYRVLEHVAHVESSLSEDLYLSFEWMSHEVAILHAKVVPMMLPLWAGFMVMLAGMALRLWFFEAPDRASRKEV